jgi:DNA-binding CsgD family transcriptional regulator
VDFPLPEGPARQTNSVRGCGGADGASDLRPATAREIDLLKLVAKGLSNEEIAVEIDLSEHTVKTHLKSIYFKLNATSRTGEVAIAVQRGLIDFERDIEV